MSSKKHKLSSKRNRASEELAHDYDHKKFVNASVVEKFGLISKNRSFIKEKGFHHPYDFFRKTIANKGWRALFQPPRSTATIVVREWYTNLASHILKRVWVCKVLVDFSAKSINRYYNLEPINSKAYDRLHENPNYTEVLRMLTNGQGEWKLNNEGHAVHFETWPTFLRYGITSSHCVSSRRPMYAKWRPREPFLTVSSSRTSHLMSTRL